MTVHPEVVALYGVVITLWVAELIATTLERGHWTRGRGRGGGASASGRGRGSRLRYLPYERPTIPASKTCFFDGPRHNVNYGPSVLDDERLDKVKPRCIHFGSEFWAIQIPGKVVRVLMRES